MSFTSIPDRRIRHIVFRTFRHEKHDRIWALLHGEMPWDCSFMPPYAEEWWTHEKKKEGYTYAQSTVRYVRACLRELGIRVLIDGSNAEISVNAVEDFSKAERLLVKSHCLRRAGIIYAATQVAEAAPGLPIFKVTLLGDCDNGEKYKRHGLWRDVYLPGRLDVMGINHIHELMGERRRNARYGSFKRKGIHFTVLNIYARNTLRKAINTAKKVCRRGTEGVHHELIRVVQLRKR
jgi:hypothetical protein